MSRYTNGDLGRDLKDAFRSRKKRSLNTTVLSRPKVSQYSKQGKEQGKSDKNLVLATPLKKRKHR